MTKEFDNGKKGRKPSGGRQEDLFNSLESIAVMRKSSFKWKIELVKQGVTKDQLAILKDTLGLEYATLGKMLSVTDRTLYLKKDKEVFSQSVSDRIMSIVDVYGHAYDIFRDRKKVVQWMKRKNKAFGDLAPLEVMDTQVGMQEVQHELRRLEMGIY